MEHLNHRQCKCLQFLSSNCFGQGNKLLKSQASLSMFFFLLNLKSFILYKKEVYNDLSLQLYALFNFQLGK